MKILLLLLILVAGLTGCGLKGPLYLPAEDAPPAAGSEQDAGTAADEAEKAEDKSRKKDINSPGR